jgi:oligopeptidase B
MVEKIEAPSATRRPDVLRHNGRERVDDWYWLRDRDDPEVLAYLEAENAHTARELAHLEPLRERIFEEIKGRVRETDASAPLPWGPWEYFTRTIEGHEYAVHCRRPRGQPALPDPYAPPGASPGEVVVLDQNTIAEGSEYFLLRGFAVSPDHQRLAFSTDFTGGERSTLCFRDLATGDDVADRVDDVYYGIEWFNDNATVLYVRADEAMRPWQVWRHRLGSPTAEDTLVIQEDDERFELRLSSSRTLRYILITSASKLTTEVHVCDRDDPECEPRLIAPRDQGIEYHVEHHRDAELGDRFFVLTNAGDSPNFRLMVTDADDPGRDRWTEVVPHRDDVRLVDVDAFAGHLVLSERSEALERIRIVRLADGVEHELEMSEEVYAAWVGANLEFDTTTLRYVYTSLVAPVTELDYDIDARSSTVVKQQPVADYDPSEFETHRLWATAPDGVRVPISLVRRRGEARDGSTPLLLYGYGSYEHSIDANFSVARLSLMQRGVAYAIAHVRGGGELGRSWYEDGKFRSKRNTFTDYIACAEHLISERYTAPELLVARGGSAGGLLMGAITNMRPELFRAVVAEVPFVDTLTTMLDARLPLTVTEWEEWGNPVEDPEVYDYIESYSPYDNIREQEYPAILATAGLNDPRVQYWEPAKWVAKLRANATGTRPIFLKTELGAGHHGPSGRYESWRDEAFVLAFILDQVGASA